VANIVEQTDPLLQLLLCSDRGCDCLEISDNQLDDLFAKFFEQIALDRALAKSSNGSEPS
jgi:hypothetical protein